MLNIVYFAALLQTSQSSNPILAFLPMILILGIFYFLLFMPMQRQKKQQRQMLAGLQNGNVVQTTGGMIGTVVSLNSDDDTLVLRVKPDNIKIQVARSAVAGLISENSGSGNNRSSWHSRLHVNRRGVGMDKSLRTKAAVDRGRYPDLHLWDYRNPEVEGRTDRQLEPQHQVGA